MMCVKRVRKIPRRCGKTRRGDSSRQPSKVNPQSRESGLLPASLAGDTAPFVWSFPNSSSLSEIGCVVAVKDFAVAISETKLSSERITGYFSLGLMTNGSWLFSVTEKKYRSWTGPIVNRSRGRSDCI